MAILFLCTTFTRAQDSQFLFDLNGNLFLQRAATTALPQIIGQPQSRIVAPDEAASFFVVALDTRALTYQWRFNGANIGGATNDAFVVRPVSTNNEGEYRVVLANPSGSVTSAPAMLWIDGDADGLPDSWELTNFGTLTNSAAADFDREGVSNLQEFLDGTNPTNSASALFRLTVVRDGGSVLVSPELSSYTNGQNVTLTAIASPGAEPFHAWLGDVVTRSNPITLVMTNNKTVFARFTPIVFTWTNRAGGDWNIATNWTPNFVPGSNDSVVIRGFGNFGGPDSFTVTLDSPADCADISLGGPLSAPILTGSGTLTVRRSFFWDRGTMSGSGRTVLEAGAVLDVAVDVTLNGRTLENGGTVFCRGSGTIFMNSGVVITNRAGALFHVQNAASLVVNVGTGRFDNAGTFRKSADFETNTIPSTIAFNNSGTVEVQTGTLILNGGVTNSGSFEVTTGATLVFSGSTFALNPGSQLNGAGLYRIRTGTVTATPDIVVENLELIAGTFTGGGKLTVATAMTWTGGTMSGNGRTVIPAGATLEINNTIPGTPALSTRTLENGGAIFFSGTSIFSVSGGAVITNRPGALFRIENESAIGLGGGVANGRFDNAGTFRKTAGTGTSTVVNFLSFNNSGAVEIQSGTLSLGGGGTHTGSFDVPAGTGLTFTGPTLSSTHTAGGGSTITGAGQFTVSGGTANLAGLINVSGSNTFSGGTANLTGNYLCTNNTLRISGGTANFNGTGTVSPAVVSLSGGTLGGSNLVTVGSAMNWTGGTMSGSGRTIIPVGATLEINNTIPGTPALSTRTLENGGAIFFSGTSIFSVSGGAIITNRAGALFNVENENAGGLGGGLANGRFDNAGTFRKSAGTGTSTVVSGLNFNNSGAVEIQTGTLLCSGGFTNHGTVTLAAGTTHRLAGDGSGSGVFAAPAAALVEWTGGTFTLNAGAQLNGAGLYKINGGTLAANPDLTVENLDLIRGTLGGAGMVTVSQAMNWTGGTMSGSGRTIIPAGVTLNAAVPSSITLSARTLENAGTVLLTGAGFLAMNSSAVITNRLGALFRVESEGTTTLGGGAANGRFNNAGTFRKSAGTGTTTIAAGLSFTNSGTVDIRSGILAANGNFASTSNALLNCALGGTNAGTGYGQLQKSGTVTLNGALSVEFINGFQPATDDAFTVVSAATRSGTFARFLYPSNQVTMQLSNTPTSVIVRVTSVFTDAPQPLLLLPEISGTNVRLAWTVVTNAIYRVEFNPNLAPSNWTALPGDVLGISNTASKLDPLTPSNRFYRVRLLP